MKLNHLIGVLALGTMSLSAMANTSTTDITVFANVPSSTFSVTPVPSISGDQELVYQAATQTLKGLSYQFQIVKPTNNKLTAQLNGTPNIINGGSTIPLDVTFAGTSLSASVAEDVVASGTAGASSEALTITVPSTASLVAGRYYGNVSITFSGVVVTP